MSTITAFIIECLKGEVLRRRAFSTIAVVVESFAFFFYKIGVFKSSTYSKPQTKRGLTVAIKPPKTSQPRLETQLNQSNILKFSHT